MSLSQSLNMSDLISELQQLHQKANTRQIGIKNSIFLSASLGRVLFISTQVGLSPCSVD